MTKDKAIAILIKSNEEFMEIISFLKEENDFLTDTIVKNNLGEIKNERLYLHKKMAQVESEAKLSLDRANSIKNEYSEKLHDVQAKQNNIDQYIDQKAQKITEKIKNEYKEKEMNNDKRLAEQIAENNEKLQEQIKKNNKTYKTFLGITIISIIFGIAGIILYFS